MPINGGLKVVHQNARTPAMGFYERVFSFYDEKTAADMKAWWGDQTSIIEAIGRDNFKQRKSDDIFVDGIKIRLMHCDQYNFTPAKRPYKIWKAVRKKKVLHFKGDRKRMMLHYWNLYLAFEEDKNWNNYWRAFNTRCRLFWEILKREKYSA
jgi:hypothetical protein